MSVITIVGAGLMGTSIGYPARENGNEVRLVGTPLDREIIDHARSTGRHPRLKSKRGIPDGYKYYQVEQLGEALDGADLLVSGVSSFGVDWFLHNVFPLVPESLPVLCVTKGMQDTEDGRLVPYPHMYADALKGRKLSINAVGGPCTSYELADHDPSAVCFCGDDMETLRSMKAMFETEYYNVSLSTDVVGVECAVAMKNAYALGVALAVGLAERREGEGAIHYNSQAALFGQSVREMGKMLELVGGGAENIVWGAGDLYVTIYGGRTRQIGILLGRGLSFAEALDVLKDDTLESFVVATNAVRALRKMIAQGKAKEADFPLLLHIDALINKGAEVDIPWKAFETETVK